MWGRRAALYHWRRADLQPGLAVADRIELTRVHGSFEADAFFPEIGDDWKLVWEEHHPADDRHKYGFTYLTYERK